jgi:ABC-type branched-subunit amino acid transport system substrate-binding protein
VIRTSGTRLLVLIAAVLLLATACGSSKSNSSGGGGSSGKTITIGVLTDLTGVAASGNKNTIEGVKAGVAWAKTQGYTIKYDVADTGSSPATTLSGAQALVEQDHVTAVITGSSLTFAAAPYLKAQGVPVIGLAEDGPEWATDLNMFGVSGPTPTNTVSTSIGDFFKLEGVTVVGTVGYGISPSSSEFSKSAAASAQHAGLKVGYTNGNFPFGSTNVAPVALAMKAAGVNGIYAPIDANTAFALSTALKQEGADVKVALYATGYGSDLTQAGPNAVEVAQGLYFGISEEPVEMHTAATEQFQKYLTEAGITGEPALDEYNGYTAVGLLVAGLQATSGPVTRASLIAGLSTIHNWTDMGLWGGRSFDINDRTTTADIPDSCIWVVKLVGPNFVPVTGADPMCGTVIPGLTVTAG